MGAYIGLHKFHTFVYSVKLAFRGIAITEFFYVAGRFRLMPGLEGWMFRAPDTWDCKGFPLLGFPLCPGFFYDKFHFMSYLIKNHTLIYSCFSHAVIIRVSQNFVCTLTFV